MSTVSILSGAFSRRALPFTFEDPPSRPKISNTLLLIRGLPDLPESVIFRQNSNKGLKIHFDGFFKYFEPPRFLTTHLRTI